MSNEVPEQPVVSPVSGGIFEKRLIVKFIQENGTDPINGKELTEDSLIDIKSKFPSTPFCLHINTDERFNIGLGTGVESALLRFHYFFNLISGVSW